MNISKLLIGGIVGGIVFFLLGWLVFGTLLVDFQKNNPGLALNVDRKEDDLMWLGIGNLLHGFLFAYILIKANVQSIANGFITGGIVGLLISAAYNCIMYGTSNIVSKKWMLADVVAITLMSAIACAIITMVIKPRATATA